MAGKADDPMVQRIGDFLTGYLRANPEAAGRLMAEGKSVGGARDALVAHARKLPHKNSEGRAFEDSEPKRDSARNTYRCVVMEDEAAYAVVLGYYGLAGGRAAMAARPVATARVSEALDLDALLGL